MLENPGRLKGQVSCLFRTEIRSAIGRGTRAVNADLYQQADQEIFDPVYMSLERRYVEILRQLDRDLESAGDRTSE